jgi:hypothetical protein
VAPTRAERRERERAGSRDARPASAASTALASPIATDGLPLRVTATPFKGSGNKARVVMVLELDASTLDFVREGNRLVSRFDVSYLATDAKRRIYPEVRHPATVTVDAVSLDTVSLDAARVRVVTDLEMEQGRYQVRVAAATTARNGSVVYDLEVPDFSDEDLALSGLALLAPSEALVLTLRADRRGDPLTGAKCYSERCTSPGGTAVPLGADAADLQLLDGRLPAPPTTAREFGANEAVVLVAEVYDRSRIRRDAPHTIEVTALLRDAAGRTWPLGGAERTATARRSDAGGHVFSLRLPLEDVPAGLYALRLEARSTAGGGRLVSREIPIRVRQAER